MEMMTGGGVLATIAALAFGYLLGSIPFGLVLTKMAGLGDIRSIGSGNIGATNVLRTGNKKLAALTLALDALKGAVAVLVAGMIDPMAALFAGFGAFLGHLYPAWLGFKGGKGVATYLGILIVVTWKGALVFAIVWLGTAFATRYSSLAALLAAIAVPLALFILGMNAPAILFLLMSLLVFIKHRQNISRLMNGSESKIGAKG
ncbi:Lysophosphatidic acid synthase [Nitratireductor basaltis]|uniref:Glycerol-3-phosphate acyltransferase n=2 Tax=Nitratireductor basaltis TaxID=472175 RepID=A0A084UB83_9HYPH|nr:Lysophosphatidic acid synthase [Nitratireductor basaltis]